MILLRRGGSHSDRGLEVLMLQRGAKARFMPGVWVFAGGVVDDADRESNDGAPGEIDSDELAHRVCGARELGEEAGVEIDAASLRPWSRWVTPEPVPARFDTRFYVALAPPHCSPEPDGVEMDAARWISPAAGLDEHTRDELELSFPTIKHLEELRAYASAEEVMDAAEGREVVAITPRVVGTEDSFTVLLPWDPGFDG